MLKYLLLVASLFTAADAGAVGRIRNSDISASAGIVYSKLNLSGSIVNADISNSAAIAYSKLMLTGSILSTDLAGSIWASKLEQLPSMSILGNDTGASRSPKIVTATEFANMQRVNVTASASIAASNIDWSTADYFERTLAASTTLTFSNQRKGQCILIDLTNTTSNYTVTWPANVRWPSDATPTATVGAKSDVTSCCYNGTVTKCSAVQNFRSN